MLKATSSMTFSLQGQQHCWPLITHTTSGTAQRSCTFTRAEHRPLPLLASFHLRLCRECQLQVSTGLKAEDQQLCMGNGSSFWALSSGPLGSCMQCLANRCLVHSEGLMEQSTTEGLHETPKDQESLPGAPTVLDTLTSGRMACLEGRAKGGSDDMCTFALYMLLLLQSSVQA